MYAFLISPIRVKYSIHHSTSLNNPKYKTQ
jgi:hypothetical protein